MQKLHQVVLDAEYKQLLITRCLSKVLHMNKRHFLKQHNDSKRPNYETIDICCSLRAAMYDREFLSCRLIRSLLQRERTR